MRTHPLPPVDRTAAWFPMFASGPRQCGIPGSPICSPGAPGISAWTANYFPGALRSPGRDATVGGEEASQALPRGRQA